ncbi:DUF3298 and DUF4163 domain-containing protein [Anaerotignum sp. MB30-C6]|uniref:DUF3298 and DUF4163 domain-containing protein n=1 Tax=Anaerotignum sp. MB30-C6 TaxID=3070814 RepID=UPI0027DC9012|nr:anti-sigma-V factor rsiV [Anaerotignum sp. MB30-C6]WMI81031.1 DUF3298 domain-containing protein [Anaerotignum sp. MB30-C6]
MNQTLKKLKKEYETLSASKELEERINAIMKNEKKKQPWVKITTIAASTVITASIALNASPNLAYAMTEVPGMDTVVKILTFGRYVNQENGYEADIVTPQIEGLLNKELQDQLNAEFKENADALIAAFEKDVKALKEKFGDEMVHMGIDSNYIIKTDNNDYLAIDVYILNTAGSSSTVHTFYTIDKHTNQLVTLPSLFQEGADYITPISQYITSEMERLNNEEDGMFWIAGQTEFGEGFKAILSDQNFYINSEGNLVIAFDKYDVAAGAQGSPEFVIPQNIIADILK